MSSAEIADAAAAAPAVLSISWLDSLTLLVALLSSTIPMLAHHAVAAEFDSNKPIKFAGSVKSVDWMNPHIYINIEAKDESGKTIVYSVEGGPPNSLFRAGWRPDSLKIGEVVSVTGSRAKSEASYRVSGTITKADGTRVWGGGAAAQQ